MTAVKRILLRYKPEESPSEADRSNDVKQEDTVTPTTVVFR